MRVKKIGATAGIVLGAALMAAGPVTVAGAAFPGTNDVLAFASQATFGSSSNTGAQILYQVLPSNPPGTPANVTTSGFSGGGADAEPFYSADGSWLYFTSNRDAIGDWVVYSMPGGVALNSGTALDNATEVSQLSGAEAFNDYSPSLDPTGSTLLFIRDNGTSPALYSEAVTAGQPSPAGPQLCYGVSNGLPAGLAIPGTGALNGAASRPVISPDGTKLVYVDASYQLHLVTGRCGVPGAYSDTAMTTGVSRYENPDWAPDSSKLLIDTTAFPSIGTNVLATISATSPFAVTNLWGAAALIGTSGKHQGAEYQPVFSPDGKDFAFTEEGTGSQVYYSDAYGAAAGSAQADVTVNLTAGTCTTKKCTALSSQPDWRPAPGSGPALPEAPYAILLPGAAIGIGALALVRGRRRAGTA
jgi:Tol biopolymer transport system component